MTTVESFQVVAAVAAAVGVLAFLVPGLRGAPATPRRAAALGMTIAAWLLLLGSLVSRDDFDRVVDRLDTPARTLAAVAAVAVGVVISLLAIRLCLRRPVAWFVLLALALPIRIPVSLGGDRAGNLLVPLYWVIAVGVIAWVWGRSRGRLAAQSTGSVLDVPVAAFTAFALVSTWWSGDIHEAVVKAVFFYIPFVVLYRMVVNWWPVATRPLRAVALTSIGMATAMAIVALGQFATSTIWWNDTLRQGNVYNRFFRANGLFYDPNILGRYLMLALVAAAAYAWFARSGRSLAVLGVLAAVIAAGLVVTFSRSSAAGLIVAVALLSIKAFGWRRSLLVGGAALVLTGGPAIALNANLRDKATSVERLAGTGEGRYRLVKGGVDLWKTAPVAGVGLGAFSEEYRQTLPRRDQRRTRVFISHTAPVTVLAELGLIGASLFVILCGTTLVVLWRGSRRGGPDGWAQWAILAILAGILVHSLLYSGLFEDPFVWTLAAAGVALGRVTSSVDEREVTQALPAVASAPAG